MKVELIKNCTYHASSYVFDHKRSDTRIQEVPDKLGEILINSDYFKELKEEVNEDELTKDCKSCICSECGNLTQCSKSICKACKFGKNDGTFDQWKKICDNFIES